MSRKPSILDSLPSYGEGFSDYQRSAILASFPRYDPGILDNGETDVAESTRIRNHTNLLAFQPRGRKRVEGEPKQKKKVTRRPVKNEILDDIEGNNSNQQQNGKRRRPTRRAAPKQFKNVAEEASSNDDDFM